MYYSVFAIKLLPSIYTQVEVTDVNDNAPSFTGPTYVKVRRKQLVNYESHFNLSDPDSWTLGNGPPFRAFLDPKAPSLIANAVTVAYKSGTIKKGENKNNYSYHHLSKKTFPTYFSSSALTNPKFEMALNNMPSCHLPPLRKCGHLPKHFY